MGSIRELSIENGELRGTAYFASDEMSRQAYQNYVDGHLTDFSVGAATREVKYSKGQRIVTRSELIEGSAVVRGADPNAKAFPTLRAYTEPYQVKEEAMDAAFRAALVERGLPEDASDADALAFLGTLERKAEEKPEPDKPKAEEKPVERADAGDDLIERELKRRDDIKALCKKHNIDEQLTRTFVESGQSVERISSRILDQLTKAGEPTKSADPETTVTGGVSEREKVYRAMADGLAIRCLSGYDPNEAKAHCAKRKEMDGVRRCEDIAKLYQSPSDGASQFAYMRLPEIARQMLVRAGERIDGLPEHEIVRRAMAYNFIERGTYHTTGSFANLMLDAAKKTLLMAYDEAPSTYQMWARTAPSTSDFKAINRIRFGELPIPEVVPENGKYPEAKPSDAKESYKPEKHGGIFSITMEAVVNDDLGAITRIPQMQGASMRRRINQDVYAILTANAALADGTALFASGHANNGTAALAESALDTAYAAMRKQTGLNASTILNVIPRYLIVPAALGGTALRLANAATAVVPEAVGNVPLYGPNGVRSLVVVEDAELDANSATAWYLAASPMQIDTVELTFLQGEESPVLERETQFDTDGIAYKIRQTYGVKAIDHRGLYRSTGGG